MTDGTAVKFTGIDHTFNVYSTFVEFNIGSSVFSIKFYGLIIAFGFLLAVLFGGRMAYKWKMDLNKMLDVFAVRNDRRNYRRKALLCSL